MKRIFTIVSFFLLIFLLCSCQYKTDAERFYHEYNELLEKYPDLNLPIDILDTSSFYFTDSENIEDDHNRLEYEYTNMQEDLWSCEDDIACLYCFFEQEDDFTFDKAKESFTRLMSVYDKHFHY